MKQFALLAFAAIMGLVLSDASAFAKGSSSGRGSSGGHSSRSRPKAHKKPKHPSKKKKKKKKSPRKSSAKRPKSKGPPKKAVQRHKRSKDKRHKDSKLTKRDKGRKDKRGKTPKKLAKRNQAKIDKRIHTANQLGRKGLKNSRETVARMKALAKNPNAPRAARVAAAKAAAGKPLNAQDRQALQGLDDPAAAKRAGLSEADREAIRESLDVDADQQAPWKTRYLTVENFTKEELTIWVHYRTVKQKGWTWLPGRPVDEERALELSVKPGKVVEVEDDDGRVDASKVRIWALSKSGASLAKNKDKDWWLVPERRYWAEEMGERTYTFRPDRKARGRTTSTD
jgi:hypothetical protein